ncbi:GlxA family transcriptional regulator [Comamonas sp. GB3 AK4-5]|uniref:GlxA family transcriptional regulator n=1 Tax=Comamonas sp. GB3 AK4-5 TaxID=3231487 RepID=UPI00351E2788
MPPTSPTATIRVLFALLPHSLVLDWAGPAEALRIANQRLQAMGQSARFVLTFTSPSPQQTASVGVQLHGLAPLPPTQQLQAGGENWVVLVGQPDSGPGTQDPDGLALVDWLRGLRLQTGRLELITICAGALLAAHAGLLDGRRATTHHQYLQALAAAAPGCEVLSNRVFVSDGPLHSSAGVTAGLDLMLERIAQGCGPVLAAQVAQTMVVALRRGPHDPELSPFLQHRNHLHAALHRVQDAISQQPAADWNASTMAGLAHTSPRHLARLFATHAGIAPLDYLRHIRLATAQAALQAGANVTQAALQAGFSSDTQLRRAWQRLGWCGTPSQARPQANKAR